MNENTNNASLAGLIIETAPNRWFYIAANAQNEYATGPFSSDEFAVEHLRRFVIQGGAFRVAHLSGDEPLDLSLHPGLQSLLDRAQPPSWDAQPLAQTRRPS